MRYIPEMLGLLDHEAPIDRRITLMSLSFHLFDACPPSDYCGHAMAMISRFRHL